jgi:hypothetical protein
MAIGHTRTMDKLGHTLPLALCGAVVRARAGLAKG